MKMNTITALIDEPSKIKDARSTIGSWVNLLFAVWYLAGISYLKVPVIQSSVLQPWRKREKENRLSSKLSSLL